MDYCDICFDRPQPLEVLCLVHYVDVHADRKTWFSGDRALYVVNVHNRSSVPLERVTLNGGGSAFLDGTVRVNGCAEACADPGAGIVIPGLDAGGRVLVTWEETIEPGAPLSEHPVDLRYEYRCGGERRQGSATV